VSKYYTPKLGRLWRRAKRSDRSEGAASPVRHIDPSTYQIPAEMLVPVARKPRRKPFKLLDDAVKYCCVTRSAATVSGTATGCGSRSKAVVTAEIPLKSEAMK
jgi:hypothetical protein